MPDNKTPQPPFSINGKAYHVRIKGRTAWAPIMNEWQLKHYSDSKNYEVMAIETETPKKQQQTETKNGGASNTDSNPVRDRKPTGDGQDAINTGGANSPEDKIR